MSNSGGEMKAGEGGSVPAVPVASSVGICRVKEQYINEDYKPHVSKYLPEELRASGTERSKTLEGESISKTNGGKRNQPDDVSPIKGKTENFSPDEPPTGTDPPQPDHNNQDAASKRQRFADKNCAFFMKHGTCRFGDNCRFVHVQGQAKDEANDNDNVANTVDTTDHEAALKEDRPPRTCAQFRKKGKCGYGDKCRFSHDISTSAESGQMSGDDEDEASSRNRKRGMFNKRDRATRNAEIGARRPRVCLDFIRGNCSRGSDCRLPHPSDIEEWRTRLKGIPCRIFMETGTCPRGDECEKSHLGVTTCDESRKLNFKCPMATNHGRCPCIFSCLCEHPEEMAASPPSERDASEPIVPLEYNAFSDMCTRDLWKKHYNFARAKSAYKQLLLKRPSQGDALDDSDSIVAAIVSEMEQKSADRFSEVKTVVADDVQVPLYDAGRRCHVVTVYGRGRESVPMPERRKVDWNEKLYLAPLTTVGNLPFRRVCVAYGAEVTCSEMTTAYYALRGRSREVSLLRRHESEKCFGVQLCSSLSSMMCNAVQLVCDTCDVDFIDLNAACPLEVNVKHGSGAGLLTRSRSLPEMVEGMVRTADVPVSVKLRTGVKEGDHLVEQYIPGLIDAGASMLTLHGRSRNQRYTKLADWSYVDKCAELAAPVPLYGCGDILSFEDYEERLGSTAVSGCMIGRGALIKPWIFSEIKERRHWDISSHERFEMLKRFTSFGLEHWGSDEIGVSCLRRYLLEWLSFLHRYVPIGLLERVPQKMNERPPAFIGRDDLETLMGSPNCDDWVKLTEMLLYPVPDDFRFVPKHRASAYS